MRDTNSAINRIENTRVQPSKITTPGGPAYIVDQTTQEAEPKEISFSIEGVSFAIHRYASAIQRLADDWEFNFKVFEANANPMASSSVVSKLYISLRGTDLPPTDFFQKLTIDFGVQINF